MRAQEKYPKRRAPGGLSGHQSAIADRIPCASRHFERSPNSQDLPRLRLANPAQTGRLAQSRNGCDARCSSGYPTPRVIFVGALSRARSSLVIPAKAGIQQHSARAIGSRLPHQTPQETRVAGKPPGPPFFWVLFFGGAKKSTSPFRAKQEFKSGASS